METRIKERGNTATAAVISCAPFQASISYSFPLFPPSSLSLSLSACVLLLASTFSSSAASLPDITMFLRKHPKEKVLTSITMHLQGIR